MLDWWRQRRAGRTIGGALYVSAATQARQPKFFAEWGVPDTVEGRFEMLALHLVIVLARIGRIDGASGTKTARALVDAFVVDMDIVMRKVGIGDPAVPRKMKKVTGALYDRHHAYGPALTAVDDAPGAVNLFTDTIDTHMRALKGDNRIDCVALARYSVKATGALNRQSDVDLLAGRIDFPAP
jgi:cytochrome b pre-mRNA-processing protein 3